MKKLFLVVAVLMVAEAGAVTDLLACGDKFLMIGRGTRYQRAALARQPAAILVYANPASALPKALGKVAIDDTLRKAGYRPTSVSSMADLDKALRQGGWDVVLADLADGPDVRVRLTGDAAAPVILPVAYNVTSTALSLAKKEYAHIVKGPVKSQALLVAIDDLLALKEKQRGKAGKSTT